MSSLPKDIQDKLIFARLHLFNHHPFFASLAMYLRPRIDNRIPTAGVTAKGDLFLNEEFIRSLDHEAMVFVVVHEVMHLVTLTHDRLPVGGHPVLFNIASDIVINKAIVDAGIPLPDANMIKPLHSKYDRSLSKYDGWFTEPVYYDLLKEVKNAPKGSDSGDGSGNSDGDCPNGGSTGDKSSDGQFHGYWWDGSGQATAEEKVTDEQKAQWKQRAASAAAAAKSAGKFPGSIEAFVTTLLKPKNDWRKYLRNTASSVLKGNWTWKQISRRTCGAVRTPGRVKTLPSAVVYIDTSGSISDQELTRFLSETSEIIKLGGGKCRLLLGDAEIYYDGEVGVGDIANRLPVQRGGTDFRVLFDAIAEHKIRPALVVGFTDLCGPFPDAPPGFKVVWCVPEGSWSGRGQAPFGEVIKVEL